MAWKRLLNGYDRLLSAMMALAMAIIPLMALVVTFEVVMRYGFNSPTIWAVDLAGFGLLWVTFLAAPWLLRTNGHMVISFFFDKFSPRVQRVLLSLLYLTAGTVSALLFVQGVDATVQAYLSNARTVGSWEVPRAYVWVIIPIGSSLLTIEFVRGAVVSIWRGPSDAHAAEVSDDVGSAL